MTDRIKRILLVTSDARAVRTGMTNGSAAWQGGYCITGMAILFMVDN
jgi:hypothetical protein